MPTRPSLVLVRLDLSLRSPGDVVPLSSAAREAIRAARSVRAEGLDIGVVFCPPRTKSVPSVKALLGELHGWPLQVLTERLLDLPAVTDPQDGSRPDTLDTPDDDMMAVAIAEFYASRVVPFLLIQQNVLLAGSTESLTRLRRLLEGNGKPLSDQENLPSGEPLYYTFDRKLQPLPRREELHWYDLLHFRPL